MGDLYISTSLKSRPWKLIGLNKVAIISKHFPLVKLFDWLGNRCQIGGWKKVFSLVFLQMLCFWSVATAWPLPSSKVTFRTRQINGEELIDWKEFPPLFNQLWKLAAFLCLAWINELHIEENEGVEVDLSTRPALDQRAALFAPKTRNSGNATHKIGIGL